MNSLLSTLEREVTFYTSEGEDSWGGATYVELATVSGILSLGTGSVEPDRVTEQARQSARFHFAPFTGMSDLKIGSTFEHDGVLYEIQALDLSGRLPGAPYTCRVEGAKQ